MSIYEFGKWSEVEVVLWFSIILAPIAARVLLAETDGILWCRPLWRAKHDMQLKYSLQMQYACEVKFSSNDTVITTNPQRYSRYPKRGCSGGPIDGFGYNGERVTAFFPRRLTLPGMHYISFTFKSFRTGPTLPGVWCSVRICNCNGFVQFNLQKIFSKWSCSVCHSNKRNQNVMFFSGYRMPEFFDQEFT